MSLMLPFTDKDGHRLTFSQFLSKVKNSLKLSDLNSVLAYCGGVLVIYHFMVYANCFTDYLG